MSKISDRPSSSGATSGPSNPSREKQVSRREPAAQTTPARTEPAAGDRHNLSLEARQPETPSTRLEGLQGALMEAYGTPETAGPEAPSSPADFEPSAELPQHTLEHPAGPAAVPVDEFPPEELNEDGTPRTGTLFNDYDIDGGITNHRYVTVSPLDVDSREAAEQAFYEFNAPTHEALNGEPNPLDQTEGYVDPTGPLPRDLDGTDIDISASTLLPGGRFVRAAERAGLLPTLDVNTLGGHVYTERGRTEAGTPWAINTTIPGEHPLRGHITRSLIEHDGQFFVRTEGVGTGETFSPIGAERNPDSLMTQALGGFSLTNFANGGFRDIVNTWVGPATFSNLDDRLAARAAELEGR